MTADDLAEELRQILPGPPLARDDFVARAINHLEVFPDTTGLVRKLRDLDGQMERLEAASRKFAQAVAAVSNDAWDLIGQDIVTDLHRDRPRAWTKVAEQREADQATRAVGLADMVVHSMREAGGVAEKLVEATSIRRARWSKQMADEEKKINPDAAFRSLVRLLVQCHIGAYGRRPSYSHHGYFCRALARVIEVARIPRKIDGPIALPSEEWLRDLVDEVAGPDVPPPKRGRKLH